MKWKELADLICNMAIYVDGNLDCEELKELDDIVSVSGNHIVTKFGEFIVAGSDDSSLILVITDEYLAPCEAGGQDATAIEMVPVDDQAAKFGVGSFTDRWGNAIPDATIVQFMLDNDHKEDTV